MSLGLESAQGQRGAPCPGLEQLSRAAGQCGGPPRGGRTRPRVPRTLPIWRALRLRAQPRRRGLGAPSPRGPCAVLGTWLSGWAAAAHGPVPKHPSGLGRLLLRSRRRVRLGRTGEWARRGRPRPSPTERPSAGGGASAGGLGTPSGGSEPLSSGRRILLLSATQPLSEQEPEGEQSRPGIHWNSETGRRTAWNGLSSGSRKWQDAETRAGHVRLPPGGDRPSPHPHKFCTGLPGPRA